MSVRFYAAWAFVLMLALVLPFGIPYAVSGDDGSPCARYARNELSSLDLRGVRLFPLSIEMQQCIDISGEPLTFRAEIKERGPYGIPIEAYLVSSQQGVSSVGTNGNIFMAGIALLSGMVVVSTPFAFFQLRAMLARRLRSAT